MNDKDYVLLIHGIISDSGFFSKLTELLRQHYNVLSYDRSGYGDGHIVLNGDIIGNISEFGIDEKDFSVAAQAELARSIILKYAGGQAFVVGNSAGGILSLYLAENRPECLRGMILVEPSLTVDDESALLIREWNSLLNGYLEAGKIKKALTAFTGQCGGSKGAAGTTLEELKRVYRNLDNFMHGELDPIQSYKMSVESLSAIKVPVCVFITSEGSESLFAKTSKRGSEILNWNIRVISGYHNALKDNYEDAAEAIVETFVTMKESG